MNEIYRDPKEGALARRIDLLRRRRDELVTMPHAIRRVAVARGARSAGALAAVITGGITLGAAASTHVSGAISRVLPGPGPAPVATVAALGWLVGVLVYIVARAMHEHRFVVAMSKYVLPSEDLDVDLERLAHERPDDMARHMAHRLEVRSAALPVAAAAFVVPALVIYAGLALQAKGWASTSAFEEALQGHVVALFAIADAGLVAAVLMTRRSLRLPVVAPIAAMLSVGVATTALVAYSYKAFTPAWIALGAFAILGTTAVIVRKLQSERERIETEDPAAGSDMFTWKGFVRDVRAAYAWVKARVMRRKYARRALGFVAALAALAGAYELMHARHEATAPIARADLAQLAVTPPPAPSHVDTVPGQTSGYTIERRTSDIVVHAHFVNGKTIDITNLATVPEGWLARVSVGVEGPDPVIVTPFPGDSAVAPMSLHDGIPSSINVCDGKVHHLGLHLDPITYNSRDVDITLSATFELANCH